MKCYKRTTKFEKEWMTPSLMKSCMKKNALYRKYLKNPTESSKQKFREYRNRFKADKMTAKKKFYSTKFGLHRNNARETWRLIRKLLGNQTFEEQPKTFSASDGSSLTSPLDIADSFNNYFSNIGLDLAKRITTPNVSFENYLGNPLVQSLNVIPSTTNEIIEISVNLRNSHSCGVDGIDPSIARSSIPQIAYLLSTIINCSLSSGVFPSQLKAAKIVPVYKSNERNNISNYRPISILSYFSKFFEKVMYNRLYGFLAEFSIIAKSQFGFRKNHSTYMPLILLHSRIAEAMDQGKYIIGVFLDLAKAFDTVNHEILLRKLEHYGVRGVTLRWFKDYLNNRMQNVVYSSVSSSAVQVTCGVPQGSVLGPLLFLIYINDICAASHFFEFVLFADDTNLFAAGDNLDDLFNNINHNLSAVYNWFCSNKLSLNISKTNYMLFHHINKVICSDAQLYINNVSIKRVSSCKFLGVLLDEHLTLKDHINCITSKVAKNCGILSRLRQFIDVNVSLMLYYALIYPYLSYCNIVWASNYPTRLKSLRVLQKRIVRIIFHLPPSSSCRSKMVDNNLLSVSQINTFLISIFMYKYDNHMLPSSFEDFFVRSSQVHSHGLRSMNYFRTDFARTNCKFFSIRCSGPRIYSNIPTSISSLESISLFKKSLTKYLLLLDS